MGAGSRSAAPRTAAHSAPPSSFLTSCHLLSSLIRLPSGRLNLHLNRNLQNGSDITVKVLITNSFLFIY